MNRILPVTILLAAGAFSAFASVDTGLIALVPSNATAVAGIDLQKSRSSQFGQFLLSKTQANDGNFEAFMTATGFDPRRDLENVVVATAGEPGTKQHGFAVLARGTFDADKIRAAAVAKGATKSTYGGVELVENKDHDRTIAIAFPDTSVAVMADLTTMQQVIQNLSTPSTLSVDLTNRIDQVSSNDAWFVSTTGGAMLGKELSAEAGDQMAKQAQVLKSIRAVSGGVEFGSNVAVTIDATTRSDQDAVSLSDVIRFVASIVQVKRQDDPRAALLAASLDTMQLKSSGDTVHVSFSIPEKNLEQIADAGTAVDWQIEQNRKASSGADKPGSGVHNPN
jgi:hypothetical protein